MSTNPDTAPAQVEAAALLPLGKTPLSGPQVRGAACAWCAVTLSPATAVDLGERLMRILDKHLTIRPRGCRLCVAEHLPATQQAHAAGCEQCADAPGVCETARGLRHLELAVTR